MKRVFAVLLKWDLTRLWTRGAWFPPHLVCGVSVLQSNVGHEVSRTPQTRCICSANCCCWSGEHTLSSRLNRIISFFLWAINSGRWRGTEGGGCVFWHDDEEQASHQHLVSTLLNWPHCGWNIKRPARLLMLTVMDWMLLYIIYRFSCPFYSSAVSCPPVMYCTRSELTGTQWGFNPCEAAWHWSRLGARGCSRAQGASVEETHSQLQLLFHVDDKLNDKCQD